MLIQRSTDSQSAVYSVNCWHITNSQSAVWLSASSNVLGSTWVDKPQHFVYFPFLLVAASFTLNPINIATSFHLHNRQIYPTCNVICIHVYVNTHSMLLLYSFSTRYSYIYRKSMFFYIHRYMLLCPTLHLTFSCPSTLSLVTHHGF